tara:strand:- start:1182 stop:2192 length:1011 start_codon:yes stop_codon:yes gene_type:complete
MSILLNGDCLELLKEVSDNSVDLIFCDLPYGCTSCKWDCKIDLSKLWYEILRVKKLNTPIFFTTTTKFGVDLINSSPKNCPFRYDLVWVKSTSTSFLLAKKMPMRRHELVYVFYEKLPLYDLSGHTHKFLKSEDKEELDEKYKNKGGLYSKVSRNGLLKAETHYDPPLPTSVVKEPEPEPEPEPELRPEYETDSDIYGDVKRTDFKRKGGESMYNPPLPTSVVSGIRKDQHETAYGNNIHYHNNQQQNGESIYDPPLPHSLLEVKSTRGKHSTEKPVALIEWILKYFSKEGDVVLDPTMGSGSTGVACKNMNRNFIGFELDGDIYDVAISRIEGSD